MTVTVVAMTVTVVTMTVLVLPLVTVTVKVMGTVITAAVQLLAVFSL